MFSACVVGNANCSIPALVLGTTATPGGITWLLPIWGWQHWDYWLLPLDGVLSHATWGWNGNQKGHHLQDTK